MPEQEKKGIRTIFCVNNTPYKFNGKELDEETGLYYYGARYYDPRISIWLSVDPLAEQTLEPYSYVGNNPINFTDPTGMSKEGDYYKSNGTYLGSDGINDNKVYVADGKTVTTNDDGTTTTTFDNAQKLSITYSEFRKQSATIYAESSAYKMSKVTEDLKKEMFAIAYVHLNNKTAYGATSKKAEEYLSLTPEQINKSNFKTTANAAVINAQTGGFDYSYGATMWDGKEQSLFDITDNRFSTGTWELHMNTLGWNISDEHYETWKTNVGSSFKAPQQKAAPGNYKGYRNEGKMRLQSTAVYGETIFWKTN